MPIVAVRAQLASAAGTLLSSAVHVVDAASYQGGVPRLNGPMDPAMGVIDRHVPCRTCRQMAPACPGHHGHVELVRPVMHPSHFAVRRVLAVLGCVCWHCARLLRTAANAPAIERAQRQKCARGVRFLLVREACRLVRRCEACEHPGPQPRVLRVGQGSWSFALESASGREAVSVKRIYETLDRIPDADSLLLGFDPQFTHPRRLVFTVLPVLPPQVRPAVSLNPSVVNQDDLTSALAVIVKRNALLRRQLGDGTAPVVWRTTEQMLAYAVHCWIDGAEVPMPQTGFVRGASAGKSIKSIRRRIEGKQGLVRQNLLGKRTDFTARTVITGDPGVSIRELGVPLSIANNLTFPERVTERNRAELTRLAAVGAQGTLRERGARFIVRRGGVRQNLGVSGCFAPLEDGDVVERQLRDGDVVIFNRQPSLHKMSLMAHKVRVMAHSTFRMNLSCTTPYNADFDGDEMNMHVPQTHEARAEAALLMTPPTQIVSPQSNRPVMAIVQDALLGAALLTQRDSFVDFAELCQLAMELPSAPLPVPCILRPAARWSGKQVLSMLLPSVNVQRLASTHADDEPAMTPSDTRVLVRAGTLLTGYTCKKTLGNVESGLVHVLCNDCGVERAADFVDGLQRVVSAWLSLRPVSVGVQDFVVDGAVRAQIQAALDAAYARVRALGAEGVEAAPGRTVAETLEEACCDVLNKARDAIGKLVTLAVPRHNNMRLMTTVAASKGSVLNVAQTIGCVGQQNVDGQRPAPTNGRCLPCYPRAGGCVDDPHARGFVPSSYIGGLSLPEVFFHAMGGREGLIDTAVKTSETGYTQRRLVKTAEAMRVGYNRTVLDSTGTVVQWLYGDDGLDGAKVEAETPCLLRLPRAEFAARCGEGLLPAYDEVRRCWQPSRRMHSFTNVARVVELAAQRAADGPAARREDVVAAAAPLLASLRPIAAAIVEAELASSAARLRPAQLPWLVAELGRRLRGAMVHAGEMVGSIAAQSIGEPATQMTLNTFHSAGCASQRLLQGVPRLKELINATSNIRTPSLSVFVRSDGTEAGELASAQAVRSSLVFTTVACVALRAEIHYEPDPRVSAEDQPMLDAYWDVPDEAVAAAVGAGHFSPWSLRVVLCPERLAQRRLAVSDVLARVAAAAPAAFVHATDDNDDAAVIRARGLHRAGYAEAQELLAAIEAVHVAGVAGISSAVAAQRRELAWAPSGDVAPRAQWLVQTVGASFAEVARLPLVDASRLYSNDVLAMYGVLGVEVARAVLIRELRAVIEADGSYVNNRHIALLCDVMTYRGDVASFTRHGLARSDAGFLARCSFEETVEVLYNAATFGDRECIRDRGVTANIIFGQMAPVGTGCFHLLLDPQALLRAPGATALAAAPAATPVVGAPEADYDPEAYVPSTP